MQDQTNAIEVLETPVVPARTVDQYISTRGDSRHANIGALRKQCREDLDSGGPYAISLGRRGKVVLEPVAVFTGAMTARRWDRYFAKTLCESYVKAGLRTLLRSKEYQRAMDITKKLVKTTVLDAAPMLQATPTLEAMFTVIGGALKRLLTEDDQFRAIAQKSTEISIEVDEKLEELERIPHRIVRIEDVIQESGDKKSYALVVQNSGTGDSLARVDSRLLSRAGLPIEEGEAFIATKLRWSLDTEASMLTPGILDPRFDSDELAELDAYETPLPSSH